jgi:predicted enzyme related to lactoylglutathione lyase
MTAPTTGRFVWHELHTGDRAKAQKFYAALVNWEIKEVAMGPGEPYGLCLLGGKDHAGITKSMAPAGVPPHWLPYVAVENVDAAAARVKELGGKIQSPPMDIPNVGRFAVCTDPQGASFALHTHARPYPEEPAVPPVSSFCWEELSTSDPEGAAKFYSALLGYSVQEVPMGPMGTYRILKRGERQTGGITKLPPQGPQHPAWLTYVAVSDVDASTRKARELGAKVHVEPQDIPDIGRFSIIADPTGAAIALFKGKM